MSTTIRLLPPEVINRIAAGEVVERPASVLKELLENSVDAGAQRIDVHVADGGKSLIKIVDDGMGMSEDDLLLSVESHATSKIHSHEDLDAIATFGFRGEALSSIASVSLLELLTNNGNGSAGHRLRVEGGQIRGIEPAVREQGTTVTVRNLFFNTPARQKFLRSPQAEMRYINRTFRYIALAHTSLQFTLQRSDAVLQRLAPASLQQRIAEVFSDSVAEMLVPVDVAEGPYRLSGFIGRPQLVQSWRGDQFLYVNRRFVRSRGVSHAVQSGYGPAIDPRNAPFFVLFFDVDHQEVDVNVHPTKLEVRFRDDQAMYRFFFNAIRKTLADPSVTPTSFTIGPVTTAAGWRRPEQSPVVTPAAASLPLPLVPGERRNPRSFDTALIDRPQGGTPAVRPVQRPEHDFYMSENRIWQIHNKYLISHIKSGVVLIDQHNAHEQILYDKAIARINREAGKSQQLLFPLTIELQFEDMLVLGEVTQALQKIGFDLKLFGERTLVVQGKPPELRQGSEERVLRDFFEGYRSDDLKEFRGFERIAALYACHSAIKTGEPLQPEEMQQLVDELFRTSSPYFCPHGRPIVVHLALEEIDKWFLRGA